MPNSSLNDLPVSIIVPTYNEEQDIARTLAALEKLQYPDYEVILVDDGSKDKTVEIIQSFTKRLPHFRLLSQAVNRGVSSARNRGIREAAGAIIVILNADVLLPPDFLLNILPYYRQGLEWVSVSNQVENQDTVFSRFVGAESYFVNFVKKRSWVWCEGFSCTKKAAISVGLFPEAMPGCSGEDGFFGLYLEKRFPGLVASDILVTHVAPNQLKTYWHQQAGRGKGRTNHYWYVRHHSFWMLWGSSIGATLWRMLKLVFGIPVFRGWSFSIYSPHQKKDFLPFIWVGYVQEIAQLAGIWIALFQRTKAFFDFMQMRTSC